MLLKTVVCVLLLVVTAASAASYYVPTNDFPFVKGNGECPDIAVFEEFDQAAFAGMWYPQLSFPSPMGVGVSCVNLTFSDPVQGIMDVTMKAMKLPAVYLTKTGTLRAVSNGKLEINMGPSDRYGDFWVLATDHTGYVFIWSCGPDKKIANKHVVFAWIMTRQAHPAADVLSALQDQFKQKVPSAYHDDVVNMVESSHHH